MPLAVHCMYEGRRIGIDEALDLRRRRGRRESLKFYCEGCGKPVRPHQLGSTGQAEHFEHQARNPACRLSHTARQVAPALAATIKHIPIRGFHGDGDETVPVEQSRRFVHALKRAGANVQYHEYSGATHGDAAAKGYAEVDLIPWLLAQRR